MLSRDKLLRWRPGDEKMDVIGLNEHGFSYLACRVMRFTACPLKRACINLKTGMVRLGIRLV